MVQFSKSIETAAKNRSGAILLLFFLVCLISCSNPVCKNTNPIFDDYQPVSKEYKLELIKQLSIVDKSKLKYRFKEYTENENKEQIHLHIQSKELCAVLVLDVEQWNKLEQLRKVKGVSYRGARFINLQFDIEQDSLNPRFVYRDLSRILD
jgi:hypothetical protein